MSANGIKESMPAMNSLRIEDGKLYITTDVQASYFLGTNVEGFTACDDECQPTRYDEKTDEIIKLSTVGELSGVCERNVWIVETYGEGCAFEYPIAVRLLDLVAVIEQGPIEHIAIAYLIADNGEKLPIEWKLVNMIAYTIVGWDMEQYQVLMAAIEKAKEATPS